MTHYTLSPRAKNDIESIWDYTASRWGYSQAEAYLRVIQAAIETVVTNPLLGPACDDVRLGYRRDRAGSHIVFFRVVDVVDVVRILHERMDAPSRLDDLG